METKIQIIGIFFAIFWSAQITTMTRYRLFNLHFAYEDNKFIGKQIARWILGLLMNVLAIMLFFALILILQEFSGIPLAIASAISCLSLLGISRILHAFVASDTFYYKFYDNWEHEEILAEMKTKGKTHSNTVWAHLGQSIIYLLGFPLLGYLVAKMLNRL